MTQIPQHFCHKPQFKKLCIKLSTNKIAAPLSLFHFDRVLWYQVWVEAGRRDGVVSGLCLALFKLKSLLRVADERRAGMVSQKWCRGVSLWEKKQKILYVSLGEPFLGFRAPKMPNGTLLLRVRCLSVRLSVGHWAVSHEWFQVDSRIFNIMCIYIAAITINNKKKIKLKIRGLIEEMFLFGLFNVRWQWYLRNNSYACPTHGFQVFRHILKIIIVPQHQTTSI